MKLSIRDVPGAAGPLAPFLDELRRSIFNIGRESVTKEELQRTGGFMLDDNGTLILPTPGSTLPPPPKPTDFHVTVGSGVIFLEWDGIKYPGHAYTEVLRAAVNDYTVAEVVGQTEGSLYVDAVGVGSAPYFYWVRFVNVAGVTGPTSDQSGLAAQTSLSVPALLDALTAAAENPVAPYSKISWRADLFYVASTTSATPLFSVVTVPITNNGVTVPAGTYMVAAFIKNGDITNAKIANLAVDDAKIATLSVGKLLAGSIGVGQYIQSQTYVSGSSGWRINSDGTAELNNVVVRGGIYATSGTIGGLQIGSWYIQSTNYNGAGAGFRMTIDGTLDLPNGSITAGKLSVSSLSAISATLGYISAAQLEITGDSAGGWGYVRSPGKFLDTTWGWCLAYHPSGASFIDFCMGSGRFYIYHNPGVSATMVMDTPGLYFDSSGYMEFRRANVVNTGNVVAGAVSFAVSASGNKNANVWVNVPAGEAWNFLVVATYGQSNTLFTNAFGSADTDVRHVILRVAGTHIAGQIDQNPTIQEFGSYKGATFPPASQVGIAYLGEGSHNFIAETSFNFYGGNWGTNISLVVFIFKR